MLSNNSHFIDITDKKFGKYKVLKYVPGHKRAKWFCECDCGQTKEVFGWRLRNGSITSCGCNHVKHGYLKGGRKPEYRVWQGMKERCLNSKHKSYEDYGGRGIKICKRWMKFENFIADMGDRPSDLYSIERLDNYGDYESGNCCWAQKRQQSRNSRNNHIVEYNGKSQTLVEWSEELGINFSTLRTRLFRGWTVERAFST